MTLAELRGLCERRQAERANVPMDPTQLLALVEVAIAANDLSDELSSETFTNWQDDEPVTGALDLALLKLDTYLGR